MPFAVAEHIVVCCKCCKFSCSSPRDSDEDKEAFSFNLCSDGDGLLLHGTYTQRVVHTTLYLDLLEEDVEAATAPYNFNHITLFWLHKNFLTVPIFKKFRIWFTVNPGTPLKIAQFKNNLYLINMRTLGTEILLWNGNQNVSIESTTSYALSYLAHTSFINIKTSSQISASPVFPPQRTNHSINTDYYRKNTWIYDPRSTN